MKLKIGYFTKYKIRWRLEDWIEREEADNDCAIEYITKNYPR